MKDFILTYRRFFLTVLVMGILIILLWMLCNSASETTKRLKEKHLQQQAAPVAEPVESTAEQAATPSEEKDASSTEGPTKHADDGAKTP
jgi:hypothetical protein